MKKLRINFKRNILMQHVCGIDTLIPAMNNIYFSNGFAYATNEHILVKNKISEISNFDEESISKLEGKFLHHSDYAAILKHSIIKIEDDGFSAIEGTRKVKYFFNNIDVKFPNCDKLFEDLKRSEIKEIGFKPKLLVDLKNALPFDYGAVKLLFTERHKQIIVLCPNKNYESKGLIMPILID